MKTHWPLLPGSGASNPSPLLNLTASERGKLLVFPDLVSDARNLRSRARGGSSAQCPLSQSKFDLATAWGMSFVGGSGNDRQECRQDHRLRSFADDLPRVATVHAGVCPLLASW